MRTIMELKQYNKELSIQIRQQKSNVKQLQKGIKYAGIEQSSLRQLKKLYRLHHIAYCIFKGRTYDQIENPKEENKLTPDEWQKIQTIKEDIYEKNVCLSA